MHNLPTWASSHQTAASMCWDTFDACRCAMQCEACSMVRMGFALVESQLELLRGVVANFRLLLCPLAEGFLQALVPIKLCLQLRLAGEAPLQFTIALQLQYCKPPRSQTC